MSWICGVEEAGRGPVLGPMVMACCWVEEEHEGVLRKIGCKDSKLLTPGQRESVYERLTTLQQEGTIGFLLTILSPREIDAAVEGENDNLNKLELRTSARLITKALKKVPLAKAIIDCPTKNTAKYGADIKKLLEKEIEVVAEHKADVKYPVVSAASIIAKVTRDREIEKLAATIPQPIGSGYPADPVTQQFLRENYKKYAHLFRTSWATYKRARTAGNQRFLSHFAHVDEMREFDFLRAHGFTFEPPKSPYEVVRMKGPGATIIKYTTGKLVIQGREKEKVEELLKR